MTIPSWRKIRQCPRSPPFPEARCCTYLLNSRRLTFHRSCQAGVCSHRRLSPPGAAWPDGGTPLDRCALSSAASGAPHVRSLCIAGLQVNGNALGRTNLHRRPACNTVGLCANAIAFEILCSGQPSGWSWKAPCPTKGSRSCRRLRSALLSSSTAQRAKATVYISLPRAMWLKTRRTAR